MLGGVFFSPFLETNFHGLSCLLLVKDFVSACIFPSSLTVFFLFLR